MAESLSTPGKPDTLQERAPAALHQLAVEHSTLDAQLQQLNQKQHLSPEDAIEATRLKKLKLHLKDAMSAAQRLQT